jgi:hypothetical protein
MPLSPVTIYPGQPDPADRACFTLRYVSGTETGIIKVRMIDATKRMALARHDDVYLDFRRATGEAGR